MSSIQSVSIVLKKIVENMDSFQDGVHFESVIKTVSKIGSFAIKNTLPYTILRDVLVILGKYKSQSHLSLPAAQFFDEVREYYKTKNLCSHFKTAILSTFRPAVEIQILQLLAKCSEVSCVSELPQIKTAIIKSCLLEACAENSETLQFINCILKHCLIVTDYNPVVGYLSFYLNQTDMNVSISKYCTCFSSDIFGLDTLFSLSESSLPDHQFSMYFSYLTSSLIDSINLDMNKSSDILFTMIVFPKVYQRILKFCKKDNIDAFKLLQTIFNLQKSNKDTFNEEITHMLVNPIWKYLLNH